jgi:hypothetical protein
MSDLNTEEVGVEVNESMGRLTTTADDLGNSIKELRSKVEELAKTIGEEPVIDPESTVEGNLVPEGEPVNTTGEEKKEGEGESLFLGGGTFTVDNEVHGALRSKLYDMNGEKEGEGIVGAGSCSIESYSIGKVGRAASDMGNKLKNVEETLSVRVSNIQSLKNVMNTTMNKLVELVKENDTTGVAESNAKIIKEVHDKLNDEFDSQMKALQTVLNVNIKPTSADLMDLLKDNTRFQTLADKLGVSYNTPEASDRLALAYTNMSRLQMSSKKVDNALKTLEISLDKYKSLKTLDELKKVLSEVLKKNTVGKSTEKLSKVLKAISTLKGTFGNHSKIIKELKGAMENVSGGDYSTGVGRVKNVNAKSTLKTRVKTYEQTVKELFKNFISQVGSNFMDIRKSAEAVSDKLGSDISYDEDIKLFISIFEGFNSDLNNGKLFYALISLDQTMAGKELKTRFMDNLNSLIESLVVLSRYNYLSDIKKQLEMVKDTIDTYSDTILSVRSNEEHMKTGQSEFSWSDSLVDASVPASVSNTIKETIVKLKFFGNLSMLKENLNRMTKEYPNMQEGYDKLLGKSIGTKLSELQKEYVESVDRLNDKERGRGFILELYNTGKSDSDKIPKGLIETIYKLQYEAKVGLYKTVEAIDLYLLKFTEKFSSDVVALKELDDMLKQTELISAWSNTSSTANVETLFQQIQPDASKIIDYATAHAIGVKQAIKVDVFKTGDAIRKVLEASKKSIESVAVLKNIIAMFIKIGDKFSNGSLSKGNYMSSGTMYNNLVKYIWVSAFTMGYGTAGGKDGDIDAPKKDKNGYEIEKGDKDYFFDLKMTLANQPLDILGKHEKEVESKIDGLIKHFKDNHDASLTAFERLTPDQKRNITTTRNSAILTAITANNTVNVDLATLINALKTDGTEANYRATYHSLLKLKEELKGKDVFRTEDKYFVLALKAISAKVLTVVGISNLLSQPSKVSSMITNPIRSIMGAGESEVVDGAVELYIRLPLLLEFYKKIFDNGNEDYKKNKFADNDSEAIAFIPEVGSVWSGLIQCVFDESKQIANGIYSVENMKHIISEVNKIYKNYSGVDEAKLARTVVLDLISEINRRYGVLKRKEIDEFYQVKNKYSSGMNSISSNANDFDILDAAEDIDDMGPSGEFTSSAMNLTSTKSKTVQNDIELVKSFRDLISKELFTKDLEGLSNKSFTERVKYFKNEVKKSTSQQAKVEIIIKAIDDSSNINSHNSDVVLLYHELIQYPLSNLQSLYRHHMSSLIKLHIAIYHTLNKGAINDKASKNIFLLANRIDLNVDFNANKNALDNLAKVKAFIMNSSAALALNNDDISLTKVNKLTVAPRALVAPDVADLTEIARTTLVNNLINADNLLTAAQTALDAAEVTFIATTTAHAINPNAGAIARDTTARDNALADRDAAANARVVAVQAINDASSADKRKIVDKAYADLEDNNLNAGEKLSRKKVIALLGQEKLLEISNADDDVKAALNPTGRTDQEKLTNATNGLMSMLNKAAAAGKKFVNEVSIRNKRGVFTKKEIEEFVGAHKKSLASSVRVYMKLNKLATSIKMRGFTDEQINNLIAKINEIQPVADNNTLSNVKLYMCIMKWLRARNDIKNSVIDLFEENFEKIAKSTLSINNKDPSGEIALFNKNILNSLTNCNGFLTKETLLKFFLENFCSSNIDLKFVATDKYVLNYSNLQSTVEKTLESSKYFVSKLRNQLPVELINSAEKNIVNLEENYLKRMIYNQDTNLTPIFDIINLEQLNTTLSTITQNANLVVDSDNLYDIIISNKDVFSSLTNVFKSEGNSLEGSSSSYSDILRETMKSYMNKDRQWVSYNKIREAEAGSTREDTKTKSPINVLSDVFDSNFTTDNHGSILFKFNNLVARYISTFFETSSKKFYMNLVSELCKNQNSSVFGGNGLKDVFYDIQAPSISMTFPSNDSVLSETLGFVLKTFANRSINKQLQTKYHAQVAISEVSANMVEKYKAHLPVFISLFEKMINHCSMYKKLLEVTNPSEINGAVAETVIKTKKVFLYADEDAEKIYLSGSWVEGDSQAYSHFNNILNNIIDASRSIVNDASLVLKEIDHSPQFFEVKDKSIKNFFNNMGKLPVMPNSVLSNTLMNVNSSLPHSNMADSYFKLAYGSNYVLNNKAVSSDINNFLWLKEFLTSHNNSSPKVNNISMDNMPAYLMATNSLSKDLYEYKFLNKTVSQSVLGSVGLDMTYNDGANVGDHLKLDTYYSKDSRTINEILSITENSSIDTNKKLITDSVQASDNKLFDRDSARLMNIIDMNVSPINPHSLLREIPLINVYNYAFTFDDIVCKDFHFDSDNLYKNTMFEEKIITNQSAIATLLLDPYYSVNKILAGDAADIVPNSVIASDATSFTPRAAGFKDTYAVLKQSLLNPVNASGDNKVAFGHAKYIKDIVSSCAFDKDEYDLRFNTKFTRNMIFLTNLQRYLLFKIKTEVERVSSKKVNSNHIINSNIVSYDNSADRAKDDDFDYLMI